MEVLKGSTSFGRLFWLKLLLSVFIVFQLSVVIFTPNGDNAVGRFLAPVANPYIAFFELSNQWSFFAPEPGPPPIFVEYELLDSKGEEIRQGRFPDMDHPLFLRERLNRRIAATMLMMTDEARVERFMLPYLCRKNPDAKSVRLWRASYSVPSMDEVAKGLRRIGDDVHVERREISTSFCEETS